MLEQRGNGFNTLTLCKMKVVFVKKDRVWAMRVFKDKHPYEDGTGKIRVNYASCRLRFLHGITPHVQLLESEKLTYEKARELWRSAVETEWEVSKKPL